MNKFENAPHNDTVLNAGLLLIAIAWVAFAAIRGPVTSVRDDTGTPAAATSQRASDIAGAHTAHLPAAARTIVVPQVS